MFFCSAVYEDEHCDVHHYRITFHLRSGCNPCRSPGRYACFTAPESRLLRSSLRTQCATKYCIFCTLYFLNKSVFSLFAFSALTLLVGRQEGHPARKKTERWGAGVVICLERDADLHTAQLMPLPLAVSCFSKIQIGFTFLVPAHPGSPGKRAVKRVYVCVQASTAAIKRNTDPRLCCY